MKCPSFALLFRWLMFNCVDSSQYQKGLTEPNSCHRWWDASSCSVSSMQVIWIRLNTYYISKRLYWYIDYVENRKEERMMEISLMEKEVKEFASTLYSTGSQWRERSSGTLRVSGGDFVTTRARRFRIPWSLVRSVSAIPDKSELQ